MANVFSHTMFVLGLYASMFWLAQSPALAITAGAACGAIWAVVTVKWPAEPQAANTAPSASRQATSAARWVMLAVMSLPLVAAGISFWALPSRLHGGAWFLLGFGLAFPTICAGFRR